ncbi:glycosyltransferase family 2 protein [Halorubrum sp. HHNYT27]|uniref:glycosyltransferase family 2 protein n=1 Tax=Halorubrum sp. HHNYT27 TaxID=3402275 RepID=UPI003EBE59CE
MGNEPTFSIILPTYNGVDFVGDALESIQGQTFEDYELVVSDDASSDDTCAVVENHPVSPEIFLKNEENVGIGRNTNRAVSRARGKYIAFLDQDDRWLPNKLATHAETHDRESAVMAYSDYRVVSNDGSSIDTWRCPDSNSSGTSLLKQLIEEHNFVRTLSGVTLSRDLWNRLGGFDGTFQLAADYDFWFRLAESHDFEHIPELLIEKRVHDQNVSANRGLNYRELLYLLHKLSLRHPELREDIRRKRRETHFTRAWGAYLNENSHAAAKYSVRCLHDHDDILHDELGIKPYGLLGLSVLDLVSGPMALGRKILEVKRVVS